MLKNYLKIAIRNIRKQKLYSLINIFGLTLGITCCILIYLFIQDEFSYDRFHENADNIYRIEEVNYYALKSEIEPTPFFDSRSPDGIRKSPWMPAPLGPTLMERIPEITNFTRFDENGYVIRVGETSLEEDISFVDPFFFEMFSFELIQGDKTTVLSDPNNVVLTPEVAQKYFGKQNVVGETIAVTMNNEEQVFTVTGIAATPPSNSSLPFQILMHVQKKPYFERNMANWNSFNTPLFVELAPGTNIDEFNAKLNEFAEERYAEDWPRARERRSLPEDAAVMEFIALPFTGIHLDAGSEWFGASNPLYSYILGVIAILILVIACINYVTLALARSSGRAKEVGIRKASGAQRNQIALQFWGETQMLTLFAMVAGVCLAELSLPFFNSVADKSLSINYFENYGFLLAILGVAITTGLIAGSYPALILSRYQPVKVLKGMNTFQFKPRLTKGLLIVQYSLSIFLIISSVIMFKQLEYVSAKDLGYNEEQVIFVDTHRGWSAEGTALMELYRNELNGKQGIVSVSGMTPSFTRGSNRYGFMVDGEEKRSYIYYIDEELISTLGFEIVEGRAFSADRPSDETESIIVNETLVANMGWENPIGELLPWKGQENPSTVVGVVKDFHYQSLETEIQPMLFHMDPEQGGIADIAIKIEEGMIPEALESLKSVWTQVAPSTPFDYWFLDDAVARQYEQYQQWLKIMGVSTFIAILIACLGLFGLAGLTAINKTKEIGIRKVLGAGIDQIILLLNKDIVLLIVISLVIAGPASWYIMEKWLSDFAYRITIDAGVFIMSAISALVIAIATVSYHSIKAAIANPVESLRTE